MKYSYYLTFFTFFIALLFYLLPFFYQSLGTWTIIISVIFTIWALSYYKNHRTAVEVLHDDLQDIKSNQWSVGGTFLGKILGFALVVALFTLIFGGILYLLFWLDYFLISSIAAHNTYLFPLSLLGICLLSFVPCLIFNIYCKTEKRIIIKYVITFSVLFGLFLIITTVFSNQIPFDNVYSVPYKLYF